MCARSTSNHHTQIVTDEICKTCLVHQDTIQVSKEVLLKNAIRKAIDFIEATDEPEALEVLYEALKL
jgi:hypothetical protein